MAQLNTDLEGPITKNDNAFELASHFLPDGGKFFANLSKYDDVLADVLKREDYKAGDTLKLILPFFVAFGITEEKMISFSRRGLRFVPEAKEAITKIRSLMPTFIISTSYQPYVQAVCEYLDFPFDQAYSTKVSLCSVKIDASETKELKDTYRSIQALPMIKIPSHASSLADFSSEDCETIRKLDRIFWKKIWEMKSGYFLKNINPVGGKEKAESIIKTLQITGNDLSQVIYVGDSITDSDALSLVKQKEGLAISFNGNKYALKSCEISVVAENFTPVCKIADIFNKEGKKGVLNLIRKEIIDPSKVTTHIDDQWIEKSEKMRSELRGVEVAELG